jgi:hypothetical protein
MADRSMRGFKENFAGAPTVRATETAKNLQSFDEITIMSEQPATASPWIPRGSPRKGLTGDTTDGFTVAADNATPKMLVEKDDATNIRADNQILTRATPTSSKADRDKRPSFKLRTYTDAAGENL